LKELKKRGLHIEHMKAELTIDGGGLMSYGLPQAVLWLVASQALYKKEYMALGYIKGDVWIEYRHEFTKVFKILQDVNGRTGTLWTPMEGMEKRGVLHQLKELELLDLVWWCEKPPKTKTGTKPCDECKSCQTHETALWKLETYGPGFLWKNE
jgi:7-cyano-7-deazaguanine synthase in queuosine biosynthesis